MANRVSGKMLKEWLKESPLYIKKGMSLSIYNGYYHILDAGHNIVVCEKAAGQCWESYLLFMNGYYLGIADSKWNKD